MVLPKSSASDDFGFGRRGFFEMWMRCVVKILILALLVCPLGCGAGFGLGLDCCAATSSAVSRSTVSESADASHTCSCPHEKPASGTTDDSTPAPPSSPEKASCQCICGGAVFTKQCEEWTGEILVSLFSDVPVPCTPTCPFRHAVRLIANPDIGGGNFGRFLCTMHASFLC